MPVQRITALQLSEEAVATQQELVDGKRGLHPLRGCDRYQLYIARHIASNEQPFDIRGDIELPSVYSAPVGESAAEARGERRTLMLTGIEEERIALDRVAVA